ncbi:hotdog fold thioesterase [Amorphoplanes nipponensis]|uniref:Phenylacetic acid degradation protein n=1 Tax=Actinoplanes nipponensis TaxID=135950 RepID=A0A919MKA0_9ACTN|nr:PaaI family thioesterase [Actinoplanes nipponensis]GIE48291.1 phenylacetic acid degradation protein [Actinoplanes nipponensis]
MTQTQDRTRTYSWTDPAAHAALLGTTDGLTLLRGMAAGELPPPPIMNLIDIAGMEVEEGSVTFFLDPQEFHYNPLGSVHGGVISTLLDSTAACSLHSTLPAGVGYTSLDLNVKFLRAVTVESGRLTCKGGVLQKGRRTALTEARLTDSAGRLIAHATSSCMLFG